MDELRSGLFAKTALRSKFLLAGALLAIYVTSYFILMQPTIVGKTLLTNWITWPQPNYRGGYDVESRIFAPAHWLDKQIRPSFWQATVTISEHFFECDLDVPIRSSRLELWANPDCEIPVKE
jgi:hypothetical protein